MQVAEPSRGRVYLVGAGPGDPGLLTARALELIATAEVILYDRLIPASALDGARADAELLFVGKEGGAESVPQERTEALMVERALRGRTVVRLKGGDPFVFGRGGEEALALRDAGIPFEIVPGVTAGLAAGAYAGIPVTHRDLASAVALVTGHEDPEKDTAAIDWQALAAFPGTLVFYMGVRRLAQIAASLIAAGRPPSEAAAVIENGTLAAQRTVRATLEGIAQAAQDAGVRAPSITIVGSVCALADELSWLRQRPLLGRTVAVTRARAQSSQLAGRLEGLGARVVQAPAIRVHTLPIEPLDPSPYDLICVTSANGVTAFFERLAAAGLDARALASARVAAIGPGTARALAQRGVLADIVPERFVAESLVDALAGVPATRALVARASEARDVLPDALRERGIAVDVLNLYETLAEPIPTRTLELARSADYVTFTSSSTVRFFLDALGTAPGAQGAAELGDAALSPATRIVSIGPVTSAALRERGLEPHVEAAMHDVDGVIDALLGDAAAQTSKAHAR
ncbi:MAG: uroporphyrinogen methyltransferase / synthase [Solirubrobacteraceae bacterium]|nr:uroporphyrinogen methyltransferase / synthase [Solirubrobacteraceae bacterium]